RTTTPVDEDMNAHVSGGNITLTTCPFWLSPTSDASFIFTGVTARLTCPLWPLPLGRMQPE
ncbi:hypothetical protein ASPBRDRAFT_135517, partial [Aspergillus brasiliensis CBS 101740]